MSRLPVNSGQLSVDLPRPKADAQNVHGQRSHCFGALDEQLGILRNRNMKTLGVLVISLLAVAAISWAVAKGAPDRPPGVAAANWYPINDRLGLVVPAYQPDLDPLTDSGSLPPPLGSPPVARSVQPGAEGALPPGAWLRRYLMVKEGRHWDQVAITGSPLLLNQAQHGP